MLQRGTQRLFPAIGRRAIGARSYSSFTTDNTIPANSPQQPTRRSPVSSTNALPTVAHGAQDEALVEQAEEAEHKRVMQAPNRATVWSRSQKPRAEAMVGPRFEQTIMEDQPRPLAAIELIHKQPVRWTKERVVSCDGGGGPLGHPRIFINVDKPQICMCTYCGLPFAHEHHRKHLQSLPSTTYPLEPTGDAAQIPAADMNSGNARTGATTPYQTATGEAYGQR
ncbi:NADH-ubiquinone oxidoreductase [Sphaerulina musiva SO2202]|uniref:NADH-ubiquinone oxidoreductase n=1 Tax=Sphaerulina musiva (strain SO2202) TaxID=692275 RepID=N1QG83_SPHMS|nr:NADH-ubiquinone oxidoreductase [Sphaerulina musiva SO2202]EMF12312.1 NADH-ubiquinone oxidoreductase [Sphaerulina musiva SO2202]